MGADLTSEPAVASPALVRIAAASVSYGDTPVLSDVNFEVRAGDFWFLLGSNGVGKTTMVRLILGLIRPDSGSVRVEPHAHLGYVPQRCDWNPHMPTTVHEFVTLGFVGLRVTRAERVERLAAALDTVGLAGMERRDHASLSGGQRQRALIARALVRRPQLLLLDEPTNGLDPAAEEGVLQLLAALNANDGLTLLFVTHDLDLAAQHATHVALFQGGRVVTGARDEMLGAANLRRVFGKSVGARHLGGHA